MTKENFVINAVIDKSKDAKDQNEHTDITRSLLLSLRLGNPVSLNKGVVLQTYLCGTGAALLALNAACLWRRWHHAGDLTRAVADLLSALGVPLRQQVLIKVVLSSIAACAFLVDMAMIILVLRADPTSS
ncbi:uncharacterized protein [Choristoneura fumiferana]|uniref:uncharacterized protein n=1 Tax=Choristoneura fumiferana TaxID=7141 RepID=UPI003D15E4DA